MKSGNVNFIKENIGVDHACEYIVNCNSKDEQMMIL